MDVVYFETEYGPVGVAVSADAAADGGYGQSEVGRGQDRIGSSLKDALVLIRPMAEAVVAHVEEVRDRVGRRPDTVSAEMSLMCVGKGRFVVAETQAAAALKVTFTWKCSD